MGYVQLYQKISSKMILDEAKIVFSTVSVTGRPLLKSQVFDVAIVDEASQLVEAETAIILNEDLRCLVLVGDEKQLPSTTISHLCGKLMYGRSLFDRLLSVNEYSRSFLGTQYRMHPEISRWPSFKFYEGKLTDGENVFSETYSKPWHKEFPPFVIYDIKYSQEEKDISGSYFNILEANIVKVIVNKLKKCMKAESTASFLIGVISPYNGQVDQLKAILPNGGNTNVRISTVDGFQGQECDAIVFSAVRSNRTGTIGFLNDKRRLNVAITRAKYCLIVVCNSTTLNSNIVWKDYIDSSKRRKVFSSHENNQIIDSVTKKWALEQESLEDILASSKLIFEEAVWDISFSSEFKKSLNKQDDRTRRDVMKKLITLCSGKWPKHETRSSFVAESFRDIVHVYPVGTCIVVWSIDVKKSSCQQFIKVWDAVTHQRIAVAIERIQKGMKMFSSGYILRCGQKEYDDIESCYKPKCWRKIDDFIWHVNTSNVGNASNTETETNFSKEDSQVDKSTLLMKFYPLSSIIAKKLILNSLENDIPFEMSEQETSIVCSEKSMLILGRSGTGKTTVMLHKMFLMERENEKSQLNATQLLVTASRVLCEAIERSYEGLCRGTLENEADYSLKSQSAPLITTYSTFIRIIDASLRQPFFGVIAISTEEILSIIKEDYNNSFGKREVNFETFLTEFYPRFSDELNTDCSTMFTEIMSHIKGSVAAMKTAKGYLSREDYISLANSRHYSMISHEKRQVIYDSFEKYTKLKNSTQENYYDLPDAIHHIYHKLISKERRRYDINFDYVYIDEVQDLSPAQILLFKFVCNNFSGFLFAGDTAQTIAHGVGFRFELVKDLFFEEFRSEHCPVPMPDIKHLKQNFRTHSGIVNLAASVVELIIEFFPLTIDKLEPEMSLVLGPPPVFLTTSENLLEDLFQNGSLNSCDFGAEQVILVRDEETQKIVRQLSRNKALVLTVHEAKGMEFTDCLVYNFFSSSPFSNEWRIIYSAFDGHDKAHPNFEPQKHAALCVELKFLYVLLTRARQRLVIFDESISVRAPILDYWNSKELITISPLDDNIRSLFSTTSSSEEWQAKGKNFFEREQFGNAKMCFQRAGDTFNERWAEAAELEQVGNRSFVLQPVFAKTQLKKSAETFLLLSKYEDAARCYDKAGYFDDAAIHYEQCQNYKSAGGCYEKCSKWLKAACVYRLLGDCNRAMESYYKGNYYEMAFEYISSVLGSKSSRMLNDSEIIELQANCVKKSLLYFHKLNCIDEMMKFLQYLPSADAQRAFLKRYGYLDKIIDIEYANGNYAEAGAIYELNNNFIKAAECYEKSGSTLKSIECLVKKIRLNALDSNFMFTSFTIEDISLLDRVDVLMQSLDQAEKKELLLLEVDYLICCCHSPLNIQRLHELFQRACKFSDQKFRIKFLISRSLLTGLIAQYSSRSDDAKTNKGKPKATQSKGQLDQDFDFDWRLSMQCVSTIGEMLVPLYAILEYSMRNMFSKSKDRDLIAECMELFGVSLSTISGVHYYKAIHAIPAEFFGRESLELNEICSKALIFLKSFFSDVKLTEFKVIKQLKYQIIRSPSFEVYVNELNSMKKYASSPVLTMSEYFYNIYSLLNAAAHDMENMSLKRLIYGDFLHASEGILNLIHPDYPHLLKNEELATLRLSSKGIHILRAYMNDELRQVGIDHEKIALSLLYSEHAQIVQSNGIQLEKIAFSELNKLNMRKNAIQRPPEVDGRVYLIRSFLIEFQKPTKEFFYPIISSLELGLDYIWKSVNALVRGDLNFVVSPKNYLALLEKFVVFVLLERKCFDNVLLPTSVASSTLCRHRPVHVAEMVRLKHLGLEPYARSRLNQLLKSCTDNIIYFLDKVSISNFNNWIEKFNCSEEKIGFYAGSIIYRLLVLASTLFVNYSCLGFEFGDKFNKLKSITLRRESLIKNVSSFMPHVFSKYAIECESYRIISEFSSVCKSMGDALVLISASGRFNDRVDKRVQRKIIGVDERYNTVFLLSDPPVMTDNTKEEYIVPSDVEEDSKADTGEADHEVEVNLSGYKASNVCVPGEGERIVSALIRWADKARKTLKSLSASEKRGRQLERDLIDLGLLRYDDATKLYVGEVAGLVFEAEKGALEIKIMISELKGIQSLNTDELTDYCMDFQDSLNAICALSVPEAVFATNDRIAYITDVQSKLSNELQAYKADKKLDDIRNLIKKSASKKVVGRR